MHDVPSDAKRPLCPKKVRSKKLMAKASDALVRAESGATVAKVHEKLDMLQPSETSRT